MQATDTSKKRLALAIIDFLNTSAKDGTLQPDDAESIEIATNCIAESFKVDPTDKSAMTDAIGAQNLLSIYSVYEKLKGKSTASTQGTSSANEARPATPQAPPASSTPGSNKEEAETLKGQGNAAMQQKDYQKAIEFYTKALDIVPLNPIYLSNRAAAYSGALQHDKAVEDAEMAVAADPKYSKAWSRLGLAKYALGDAKGSMEAYQKGIEAEGSGGSAAMKKGFETAKKAVEEQGGDVADLPRGGPGGGAGGMPDLSSLAGMFGGGAGGGGGGGMPNFAEMMNNPMMRQMAQNIMSNPEALNGILNNPRMREMAERFGGGGAGGAGGAGGQGGGMPDLASLMNDPSIAEM